MHSSLVSSGPSLTTLSVVVRDSDDGLSSGEVCLAELDESTRTKRAVKFLAICWSIGTASILLPIVHFISVPFFFGLGIVGYLFKSKVKSEITGGHCLCSKCHSEQTFDKHSHEFPFLHFCTNCRARLEVEPKPFDTVPLDPSQPDCN